MDEERLIWWALVLGSAGWAAVGGIVLWAYRLCRVPKACLHAGAPPRT